MVIAVSACLLGENVKYNGGNNLNEKVVDYVEGHRIVPICPEILGGLTVPRASAEIVDGSVKNRDGLSVDKEFRKGAELALNIIIENKAELVILQSRSPSCGVNHIYDGTFSGRLIQGQGVFAEMVRKAGIPVMDVEDL